MRLRLSQLKYYSVFILSSLVCVAVFISLSNDNEMLFTTSKAHFFEDFEVFMRDWCRIRQPRTDIKSVLGPCSGHLKWSYERNGMQTDASKSFVSRWALKPAGQFSRFFIQAVSNAGELKTTGGDWWRVFVGSPVANLRPVVFDLWNGTYEVVFLIVEPGIYNVNITLDYTTCDGFLDPPDDWFIIGNAQGKMQPSGVLKGRAKDDYLLQPLGEGERITMNIALPNGRGLFSFTQLPPDVVKKLAKKYDFSCGMKCRVLWDGYGRWANEKWKPYLKARVGSESPLNELVNKTTAPIYDTLWIYGDSQARRMYSEILDTPLCQTLFKSCKLTRNWVYKYSGEFPTQDDLDFNQSRIINDLIGVLEMPEMTENSVLVLNLGLHYLASTNFSNYVKLLQEIMHVFTTRQKEGKKTVRMIWKTSTELSKEKDTSELLRSDYKRFLNSPRVAMFNAHATSSMCQKGFEILDVHPLTASYPGGTGGPMIEYFKEHDIVHYKMHVTRPFEDTLTKYLLGNLPDELTFEKYKFA